MRLSYCYSKKWNKSLPTKAAHLIALYDNRQSSGVWGFQTKFPHPPQSHSAATTQCGSFATQSDYSAFKTQFDYSSYVKYAMLGVTLKTSHRTFNIVTHLTRHERIELDKSSTRYAKHAGRIILSLYEYPCATPR